MELYESLIRFPVVVTTVPFLLLMVLMLLTLATGFLGDLRLFPDVDITAEGTGPEVDLGPPSWLLIPAGAGRYPLVIVLTLTFFVATIILFYADGYLSGALSGTGYLVAASAAIFLALFLGLHLAVVVLRPLAPLFDPKRVYAGIDYIAREARVSSSRVTSTSGDAVVTGGGMENQIDVYCETGDIGYGERVIVRSYDPERRRYRVERISQPD